MKNFWVAIPWLRISGHTQERYRRGVLDLIGPISKVLPIRGMGYIPVYTQKLYHLSRHSDLALSEHKVPKICHCTSQHHEVAGMIAAYFDLRKPQRNKTKRFEPDSSGFSMEHVPSQLSQPSRAPGPHLLMPVSLEKNQTFRAWCLNS